MTTPTTHIIEYVQAREFAGSDTKAVRLLELFNARVSALLRPKGATYEARQVDAQHPGSDETAAFQALGVSLFAVSDAWEECLNEL